MTLSGFVTGTTGVQCRSTDSGRNPNCVLIQGGHRVWEEGKKSLHERRKGSPSVPTSQAPLGHKRPVTAVFRQKAPHPGSCCEMVMFGPVPRFKGQDERGSPLGWLLWLPSVISHTAVRGAHGEFRQPVRVINTWPNPSRCHTLERKAVHFCYL